MYPGNVTCHGRNSWECEVQKCPSFGILVDEVTDISVIGQLIVFAKYVTDSGNPSTVFVACQVLMDGANALAIVAKIAKALEEAGLGIKCVTTFVSDGASVMIGKTDDVAVKLSDFDPLYLSQTGTSLC